MLEKRLPKKVMAGVCCRKWSVQTKLDMSFGEELSRLRLWNLRKSVTVINMLPFFLQLSVTYYLWWAFRIVFCVGGGEEEESESTGRGALGFY